MSLIRVWLDGIDGPYQDVPDGYSLAIGDEGTLEVYDDSDVLIGLFRFWHHAMPVEAEAAIASAYSLSSRPPAPAQPTEHVVSEE